MSDGKVLIVGGHGQLGFELQRCASRYLDVITLGRPEIDIADCDSVERGVQHYQPDVMIKPPPIQQLTRRRARSRRHGWSITKGQKILRVLQAGQIFD